MSDDISALSWLVIGCCLVLGFGLVKFMLSRMSGSSTASTQAPGGAQDADSSVEDATAEPSRPRDEGDGADSARAGSRDSAYPRAERGDALWYEVLGVSPGASLEEARHAWRQCMSRYHPDKVSGLGPEFVQLATTRTRQFNRALAEARAAHGVIGTPGDM